MARTFCVIPLRGGSKSIPDKNIRAVAGRPLAEWCIEAALGTRRIDKVFVSTDSDKIRQTLQHFEVSHGKDRFEIIGRNPETATDSASTESLLLEFAEKQPADVLVLVQATSPLLRSEDLDAGLIKFENEKLDSLLSVVRQKRFLWAEEAQGARPLNYDPMARPRRQDFYGQLVENGAYYVCSYRGFQLTGHRLFGKIGVYEMSEESYFEIDEPSDFTIVQELLNQRKSMGARVDLCSSLKTKKIKVVFTDVDGVLTDSGMYYSSEGDLLKKFNTRDGKAVELLKNASIRVVIVTGENSPIVLARAKKLGIEDVFMGVSDKGSCIESYMRDTAISSQNCIYIGDDINDLHAMKRVAVSVCPSDAQPEVQSAVDYICKLEGGRGVLREVADAILGSGPTL